MPEKLIDARVRSAPLRAARYSILDTKEAGLELRIHPDGRRVFALRRSVAGKDVRVTIGPYGLEPPTFTLERARAEAAALKVRFRREGDFRGAEREAQRVARESRQYTIGNLADDWLKDASKRLRASTVALHRHRIDKHIRPRFGKRALTDVTRAEIMTQMGGRATGENGNFAGHACAYWEIDQLGSSSCVTPWGATLHNRTSLAGVTIERTVTEVRMGDGGPDFAFAYDAARATQAPNLDDIRAKMRGN